VPGAKQTLIFYALRWTTGKRINGIKSKSFYKLYTGAIDKQGINIPFPLDGKYNNEWRIYARSASDDKAGVDAILNAYDAINKSGLTPTYNLKFF
jgi:hypothetical protein